MGILAILRRRWARRRLVRSLTRAVRRHSLAAFPQDLPAWSLIAEEWPDRCVIQQTYRQKSPDSTAHRYFQVTTANLAVTVLPENYHPVNWGPFN